jgi:hypothetical protein
MKKAVAFLIGLASLVLVSCTPAMASDEPFETVYSDWNYEVVYHKQTKVMYVVSIGHNNSGNFTLLVNADGKPLLYTN